MILTSKQRKKVGADFKNDLCNGMVKYFPDHFEDESKYCKALFIKKYPSSLSDRFINEITSLPVHSITSIDVVTVPKDLTTKVFCRRNILALSQISSNSRESVTRIMTFPQKSLMQRERRKKRLRRLWMMSVRMTSVFSLLVSPLFLWQRVRRSLRVSAKQWKQLKAK